MCWRCRSFLLYSFSLITGLLFTFSGAFCQNYTIKSYTTSDGLPHNNVRAIARDSTGFLWLGTWDGLSRFDGHEFKNYFHEPDDSTSLPFFSINRLFVDRADNLWIQTDTRELVRYDRNKNNFYPFEFLNELPGKFVNSVTIDEKGNLLLLGKDCLCIYDPDEAKIEKLDLFESPGVPFLTGISQFSFTLVGDSEIWTYSDSIREFRRSSGNDFVLFGKYPVVKNHQRPAFFFDFSEWRTLTESPAGNMWMFSNDGLFRLDREKGIFEEITDDFPLDEFTGKKILCWGLRGEGLYYYNPDRKELTHIPEKTAKWVVAICPDTWNTFWFSGTSAKGVAQGISMVTFVPGYFRNTLIPSPDSTSPAVYSVIMDKNRNIWAGLRGFDHIVTIMPDETLAETDKLSPQILSVAGHIRSLTPVQGGIWIGYFISLLQFYDYRTGSFTTHTPEAWGFRAVAAEKDGKLYIGTDKLLLYDPSTGKTELLWESPEAGNMFRVFADSAGIVWAGMSDSRLLRYDTRTRKGDIIRIARGTSNIEDIVPGDDGDLWLALLGKGVCRYNTITGKLKYYTTSKGLSNNTTYCILRDKHGHFWVSTNHGISMIHPESEYIRIFNETDGIAISEFNSGAKFEADDGELIFGGMGGFVRFYPDSISTVEGKSNRLRIILTKLQVSGEERIFHDNPAGADTIILDRGENNFHVAFSSTDFINSEKTKFRYQLTGENSRWIETTCENRNINYTNIRPGWHNLKIEATDQNGEWGSSRTITVMVKPSYYQTRLFRIVMPLLLLLIISSIIIIYVRQVKQRERSKQDELKLQSLRSQMNPHFIFNSLNSINYFISNNDKLSANRYIADFSRLIRSILSNMGSNYIPLEDEINSIKDYLRIEHLRFSDKFDYKMETSGIEKISNLKVCPGIVQPFIENAIWHGVRALENRKGFISIRFMPVDDKKIKCIIEDDGIGIEASLRARETNGNHKPKGIGIISERLLITGKITKINYKLEFTELYPGAKGPGTHVEVEIPALTVKNNQHDKSLGS